MGPRVALGIAAVLWIVIATAAPVEARRRGCSRQCPPAWIEAGLAQFRYDAGSTRATTTMPTDGSAPQTVAIGPDAVATDQVRFRLLLGVTGPFYFGSELAYGWITSAPQLAVASTSPPGSTTGVMVSGGLVLGSHWRTGPLTFGAELVPGIRRTLLQDESAPAVQIELDQWAIEARVKADLWLTPNVTLSALVGIDTLQADHAMFAVMIGGHFNAFDKFPGAP